MILLFSTCLPDWQGDLMNRTGWVVKLLAGTTTNYCGIQGQNIFFPFVHVTCGYFRASSIQQENPPFGDGKGGRN
jgi:hypothetical protein